MTGSTSPTPAPTARSARNRPPIVLAAGGTGGHIFPAEALAALLMAEGERVVLVTDRRGAALADKLPALEVHTVRAGSPSGGFVSKLRAIRDLILGYGEARGILRALAPACVVGFGGYPSAPTVFAAGRLALPVLLHEQNAVAGRVNRLLAGMARKVAVSFPDPKGLKPRDRAKIVLTGNPVRSAIRKNAATPYSPPDSQGPIRLVVLGGSQGARVLSDVVPEAMAALPEAIRSRLQIAQQARPEDLERVRAAYRAAGLNATVESFFTDVPRLLTGCHLAITRAGASTAAELTAIGRPAILVPYPHAMDDHQTANAISLARHGGAWVMAGDDFTPARLSDQLERLLAKPECLARAAAAMTEAGLPDADRRLAAAVRQLIGRQTDRPESGGDESAAASVDGSAPTAPAMPPAGGTAPRLIDGPHPRQSLVEAAE